MSKKNIGSNFDEFLSENSMLDEATAVAVKYVSAWKLEQEMKSRWAEIERGDVELIPATEVFTDIRRKLR
ncbi:hypothetical protein [Sideroxydans sp. CL21]|uniref:hypothetical protein n=1 Tax=Sideroxydans sp. CL21 TaxID=2600596 RepID=UPI0024BD438D|nr:hypothetical protein [Sideroxydans sp. CL21]